jgi:hypothetical protein
MLTKYSKPRLWRNISKIRQKMSKWLLILLNHRLNSLFVKILWKNQSSLSLSKSISYSWPQVIYMRGVTTLHMVSSELTAAKKESLGLRLFKE